VFEDAQREADTMFAQYQLSQLLASGETLEPLAAAVLAEIARRQAASAASRLRRHRLTGTVATVSHRRRSAADRLFARDHRGVGGGTADLGCR
jgi:hypothetical protein